MSSILISTLMAIAGGAGWTASEYVLHRFVGHGPRRTPREGLLARLTPGGLAAEFNREHLAHHTDTQYFAPTSRKLMAAVAILPVMTLALAPVAGLTGAGSFAAGFAAAYGMYEFLHRRIHTHPPTGPITRAMWRHHLLHHHKNPKLNHGVTSPLWDVICGTSAPRDRVRIPRRHAPRWLVDEGGEVRRAFVTDYELVGRAGSSGVPPVAVDQVVAAA